MSEFPHTLIRAAAGTGKTFQLSNRYLGLLARGVPPDQILATTFTRKAAGEILDRVVLRLADAALDAQERQRLAGFLELPHLTQDDCYAMLRQLLRHLHRLRICTLDAFFAQLAGSFSLELGLPPGWHIVEEVHDRYLRGEAIAGTLRGDTQHADQATREVERLIQLMAKGESQRSVSELVRSTVTKLYDLYMETDVTAWQRIPRPGLLTDVELEATLDELSHAVLPAHASIAKARTADIEAARQGDWETFIDKGLGKKILEGETVYYGKELPPDVIRLYQRLLDQARAVLLRQVAGQTEATFRLLDKFHASYAELKRRTHGLRFEDITRTLLQQAASTAANAGTVAAEVRQRYFRLDTAINHLLLDEFQDTSLAQWRVLRPFAGHVTAPGPSSSGGGTDPRRSFFCVGDVKQAIYGWRGGRAEIFDALQPVLPNLHDQSLTESFRSAPPIIETVNEIFRNLPRHGHLDRLHDAVVQWCQRFENHSTAKQGLPGYVELCTSPAADEDNSAEDMTLRYAAERVQRLAQSCPSCSIGVLVRRNEAVARLIYELRQLRVPASEEGGNPLTDSPAVQLILSLLRIADHPGDTVARYHIARSPLASRFDGSDFRDDRRAVAIGRDVRTRLVKQGYGAAIQKWAEWVEPSVDRRDRGRLEQLVELAYQYDEIATLRPSDFLRYVEGKRVADPTTAEVRVMTVHQAKGLQFDIVVLPELDALLNRQADACVVGQPAPTEPIDRVCLYRNANIQRLLPRELQVLFEQSTQRSIHEALCVLYVAVTRAIHALYMIVKPSGTGEKQLPKTAAGLLRAALTDGQAVEPQTVLYRQGDPTWYQAAERDMVAPAATAVSQWNEIPLAAPADESRAIGEHTSPSALEGGGRVDAARLLNLHSTLAMARGTLIHALFEQVSWLEDGWPDPSALRAVAERCGATAGDVQQELSAFEQMLAMPAVSNVLRRSFYAVPDHSELAGVLPQEADGRVLRLIVSNERRFAVRDQGRLLTGAIDRLVLLYDEERLVAADILDFKTDAVPQDGPRGVAELVAHYRPQIEAYRSAVGITFGLPTQRIGARLVFVSCGEVCTVR